MAVQTLGRHSPPARRAVAKAAASGSASPAPATAPASATSATREQILAAAAKLFAQQGYATTTLRQIADAAGIKAGSVYYHFEGKDDIAACVLDGGIAAMTAAVHQRLAALPPAAGQRQRLVAAIEGHLLGMLQHSDFTAAHIRIYRYVSDAARARHHGVRSAYTRLWDELLTAAAAAGALRADVPVPLIRQYLVGALNWPVDWYDPRRGSVAQLAAQISALVFDGIGIGPRRSGGSIGNPGSAADLRKGPRP
ncbi:MAG: TetR/AcrR family transcriptional regulator [Proteobacteria bacterium]|nr:TetR/AcrR family transcriptional regulator [Pseudomonadota bacterium]